MVSFHGLTYLFRHLCKDKVVLIGMFLPLVLAVGVRFISPSTFSRVNSLQTVIIQNSLDAELQDWLEVNTTLMIVDSHEQLVDLVLVPSTEAVGIVPHDVHAGGEKTTLRDSGYTHQISFILAGDESSYTKAFANNFHYLLTLPSQENPYTMALEAQEDQYTWIRQFFIAVVLLTACFIGSSFNAISMVSEKESGVFIVHGILPISRSTFVFQRVALGFIGSIIVSLLTWIIIHGIGIHIIIIFPLLLLSSYFSAVLGLYIAHGSKDYLGVIVVIKFILILFLAVPIMSTLFGDGASWYTWMYWIIPSVSVFQAITQFFDMSYINYLHNLGIILLHCILWTLLYIMVLYRRLKFL